MDLCLSQQADVNGSWTGPVVLGGPAVQVAGGQNGDGRLEVFWTDQQGNIMHNWQLTPGGNWAGQASFGGQASQLTAISDQKGRLTLIYIGPNSHIFTQWLDTGGWQSSNFGTQQAKQITVNRNADGRLEMFFIGLDNFIYNTAQQAGALLWSPPTRTAWAAKQITLGKNGDGRLEFFYVGLNDSIYHGWQPAPGAGPWKEAQLSGEAKTIVSGNTSNGLITIFYIGLDGYIYHNSQLPDGSGNWGGDIRAFQGVFYQGEAESIALARNQDGRLQLYYTGTNGVSYGTWQNSLNGSYIGGAPINTASAYSSITDADGRISLFYVGTTNPPPVPPTITLIFSPIVFPAGTAIGGNAELVLQQNGQFDFFGHYHDSSSVEAYVVGIAFGVKDASNAVYMFKRNGQSTFSNDDWNEPGTSTAIAAAWPDLVASCGWAAHASTTGGSDVCESEVLTALGQPLGPVTVVYSS